MPSFAELIQQSTGHACLFIPSTIPLGAQHGLEPGHSKTLMAAFIVAIRGTVTQAVLLGLAATVSHTIVVWGIAIGGMHLWRGASAETFEPYLQIASAIIIVAMALWMLWRTREDERHAKPASGQGDGRHGGHGGQGGHSHDHVHEELRGLDIATDGDQDAHELAHANDIRRRFAGRNVTTGQIVLFGLTGGLIRGPARRRPLCRHPWLDRALRPGCDETGGDHSAASRLI